jgi:cyclopropane fatty-acyl-phospholipid synthase-like methyltransferase
MGIMQLPFTPLSPRKEEIRRWSDATASQHAEWRQHAAFFHSEDLHYLKFLIPEGMRVLELGCSTGELLAELKPSFGVGVDLSASAIEQAIEIIFVEGHSSDGTWDEICQNQDAAEELNRRLMHSK